jgi:glycosyltransferase involved in cell wall biosynthesis
MIYLAYFVLTFTGLQLLISLVNLLFREKMTKGKLKNMPLVSVLIPARNEEENIANILEDLVRQDYKDLEIIVFNDQSEDKTPEIIREFKQKDPRITLISSEGLPAGWLGKNFACHSLSLVARGDYFLFIDADVRISGEIISNAVAYVSRYNLALISIFPKQKIYSFGEKITVPNMNFILLSLLPLILVRKSSFPSLSAANGQFMLFNSGIYKSIRPHELTRTNKAEDIEIARILKAERFRIACLTGDNTVMCRMYSGFGEAVNGFSKNVSAFFAGSISLSILFWIITTFGFIFVLLATPASVFFAYVLAYLTIRVVVSVVSEQNIYFNLLYIIPQQISIGFFICKAFINKYRKDYQWKGRNLK